jgi:sugar lactone lactonase YvrE
MKSPVAAALLVLLTTSFFVTPTAAQALKKRWETDTLLRTPESVLFDAKENVLYVACINRVVEDRFNQGSYIARVSPADGKIITQKWADQLNVTKGMGMHGDKLYVTELKAIAEINRKDGTVAKRYEVPGAVFLNDLSIDKRGVVYFSDSQGNKLHALRDGQIEMLAEGPQLQSPNGVLVDGDRLIVGGSGAGTLYAFDLKTKKITPLADGLGRTDGIVPDGRNGWFVTNWTGQIFRVKADGSKTELLNTTAEKINTADLDVDPEKKLLFVPTFFHNRVIAYEVD